MSFCFVLCSLIRTFATEMDKNLYIISGCNGAGKTTASYTVLPINLVRRAQAKGYVVKVLFFWLNSPELAQLRVSERVANGGHNIPQDVINRRYVAGISNLFNLFMQEVDSWVIFDNSENPRKQIASGGRNADTVIDEVLLYSKMQSYVK